MKITAEKYRDARNDGCVECYWQQYADKEGFAQIQKRDLQSSSDFFHSSRKRVSTDNGKTWGPWQECREIDTQMQNGNERQIWNNVYEVWNPVAEHYVSISVEHMWIGGHEKAYELFHEKYDASCFTRHGFLNIRDKNGHATSQLIRYEEGDDFDPEDIAKPTYFHKNKMFPRRNILVEDTGSILIAAEAPVSACCRLGKKDVSRLFPSYPDTADGIILIRGIWNGSSYEFEPLEPIVISDRLSSRGLLEPTIAKLKSGRILVVARGSNSCPDRWTKKRIEPGTPSFKWYAYSDDDGKTFTDPMPWHFDDGEAIYSSSTISVIQKDERTGHHYWIGNITGYKIEGNAPRWPLCIVEIDETYGTAKKASHTVIDTKREDEPDCVQLSNFNVLQNRENGNLEVMLVKYCQFYFEPGDPVFKGEVWKYAIELD